MADAALTGVLHGNTITLDSPVPPLDGRRVRVIIAPEDPEFQREGSAEKTIEQARIELFQYFDAMSRDRRAKPREDIVSVVANGQVEGQALNPVELLSYYLLLVVAGNETTRNAMTGGVLTFLEYPGEWRKLRANAAS